MTATRVQAIDDASLQFPGRHPRVEPVSTCLHLPSNINPWVPKTRLAPVTLRLCERLSWCLDLRNGAIHIHLSHPSLTGGSVPDGIEIVTLPSGTLDVI